MNSPLKKQIKASIEQRQNLSLAEQMRHDLQRYAELRHHHPQEETFREQLHRLQAWQVERLKHTHSELLVHEHYQTPTEFVLSEIYGGIDLTDLANEIERALAKALKLFPEKVMATASLALELNALTAELDEWMTVQLFEEFKVDKICGESYLEAYISLDVIDLRRRQIELGQQLANSIDKYVKSRLLYGAFKVARKPAMRAGFANLYGFMERGFGVLRPIDSTYRLLTMITDPEMRIVDLIVEGHDNPYELPHPEHITA